MAGGPLWDLNDSDHGFTSVLLLSSYKTLSLVELFLLDTQGENLRKEQKSPLLLLVCKFRALLLGMSSLAIKHLCLGVLNSDFAFYNLKIDALGHLIIEFNHSQPIQ